MKRPCIVLDRNKNKYTFLFMTYFHGFHAIKDKGLLRYIMDRWLTATITFFLWQLVARKPFIFNNIFWGNIF